MAFQEIQYDLDSIYRKQRDVKSLLAQDPNVIRRFVDGEVGSIKRSVGDGSSGTEHEDHATCTAFCLYYITRGVLIASQDPNSTFHVLSLDEATAAIDYLGNALVRLHDTNTEDSPNSTDTGPMPNPYNSSIQVAGYLRACRKLDIEPSGEVIATCRQVINVLGQEFLQPEGFVARIGGNTETPSAFLTFWVGAALYEWRRSHASVSGRNAAECEAWLNCIAKWSERELASGIAYHHAGLTSRFDVVETAYSALSTVQFGNSPASKELAKYGLTILFEKYFRDGCFAPSAPVLADRHRVSILVPTVEVLALLLRVHPDLFSDQWQALCQVFHWLHGHKSDIGWAPEGEGRYGRPNAFMTTSAIVLLKGVFDLLDDVLSAKAAEALDALPFAINLNLRRYEYPEQLGNLIRTNIIEPLKSQDRWRRSLAYYSMILHGPPGTSKTTIACKIAQELEWPLLTIKQSDFLQQGVGSMDAEADRIFRLCSYLKNTVVLFDEVEELIKERSAADDKLSRLLTTSMLPRIHHLRDLRRIVFIFATNHVKVIDEAASRIGRFDIVQVVLPPTDNERAKILQRLLEEEAAGPDITRLLTEESVIMQTRDFSYLDLKVFVQQVLVATRIENRTADHPLVQVILENAKRNIKRDRIDEFKTESRKWDRPSIVSHA
jgi:hypothetical protein